jgi:hypothetical protein
LGWRLFTGSYGSVGMIWCLIRHNINLFCRWCLGGPTGLGAEPSYLRRMVGSFWRKAACCWRLWRWRSSINLDGIL